MIFIFLIFSNLAGVFAQSPSPEPTTGSKGTTSPMERKRKEDFDRPKFEDLKLNGRLIRKRYKSCQSGIAVLDDKNASNVYDLIELLQITDPAI